MQKNLVKESESTIDKAVGFLKNNKLVSIKAETVYGVACDPSSIIAIKKLYDLKKRPSYNPLIIHMNSLDMASKFAEFNNDAKKIAQNFWPGPLTLILPKKKNNIINDFAISGLDTIAVRIPDSEVFLKILNLFNKPIAAPSANQSGYISSTKAEHVIDSFGYNIDLVLDSGNCELGIESTIIDLTTKPYFIRRPGMIDSNEITEKTSIVFETPKIDNDLSKISSPGQLKKHYSPHTPLKLNINKPRKDDAFLFFGNENKISHNPSLNLSPKGDLIEAACNLFDFLRKLDKLKMKRIAVSPIPYSGIGKTINERLTRASF